MSRERLPGGPLALLLRGGTSCLARDDGTLGPARADEFDLCVRTEDQSYRAASYNIDNGVVTSE